MFLDLVRLDFSSISPLMPNGKGCALLVKFFPLTTKNKLETYASTHQRSPDIFTRENNQIFPVNFVLPFSLSDVGLFKRKKSSQNIKYLRIPDLF